MLGARLCCYFGVVSALLFGASWLLPNHYAPWLTAYQEFLAFGALIALSFCIAFRRNVVYLPAVMLPFFLFIFFPLLQLFGVGFFSGDAWLSFFYMLGFFVSMLIGFNFSTASSSRFLVYGALVVLVGGGLSGFIALAQWLGVASSIWVVDLSPTSRPFGNFGQPNHLASLVLLAIISLWYLFESRVLGVLASGVVLFVLLFFLALTQSRTPWVYALAVFLFWCWKSRVVGGVRTRFVIAWGSIYFSLVMLLPNISDSLLLSSADPLSRALSLERWDMWRQFSHAVWEGPIWGYGWNQVSVAQMVVALEYPVGMPTEHSHNILLDILLWHGPILGGAVVFFLVVWMLLLSVKSRTRDGVFALMGSGVLLAHALLEYPLSYAFFLLPLGLMLGVPVKDLPSGRSLAMPGWVLAGLGVLGLGMSIVLWQEYRNLEESYRQMRFESARLAQPQVEGGGADILIFNQLREYLRFARTYPSSHMSNADLEWMRKVAYRYPYPSSVYRYALALGLNGQIASARSHLLILRSLHGDFRYREGIAAMRALESVYPQLSGVIAGMPD